MEAIMSGLHVTQHTVDVLEEVAVGTILGAVALAGVIAAATLLYAWLFT
jgi:hypothetical protein